MTALCSLGHDDMQYYLLDEKNRDRVLQKLGIEIDNFMSRKIEPEAFIQKCWNGNYGKKFHGEPYRPDLLEAFTFKGKYKPRLFIVWEIKPALDKLGETLRQVKKYLFWLSKGYLTYSDNEPLSIIIYNASRVPKEVIIDFFKKSNVFVYQLLPNECPRLEDLK